MHSFSCPFTQSAPPTSSPSIAHFSSLVSSVRATNPANRIRLLHIIVQMLSLAVFIRLSCPDRESSARCGCSFEDGSGLRIPFVRKYMISVLASGTVRPNAAHKTTITRILFLRIASRLQHRQREVCPKATSPGLGLRRLLPRAPVFFLRCTKASMIYLSSQGAPKRLWDLCLRKVGQSVYDALLRLETRERHVYNRREENVEQKGCEHARTSCLKRQPDATSRSTKVPHNFKYL